MCFAHTLTCTDRPLLYRAAASHRIHVHHCAESNILKQHMPNHGRNTDNISRLCPLTLSLQERVWDDVAAATSFRQADRSWACRFAVASPRFIGRRSASTVLSQDCLGRPVLRVSVRRAHYAGLESSVMILSGVGSVEMSNKGQTRRRLRTMSDRNGCPVQERISSLVTNSDQCMFRIRLRHQLSSASIVLDKVTVTDHVSAPYKNIWRMHVL